MTDEQIKKAIADISQHDHYKMVNHVKRYVFSWDVAEDCVQEAYIAAMLQCNQLSVDCNLRAWLTTVATRNAYHCVNTYNRIMELCVKVQLSSKLSDSAFASRVIVADTVASVFHMLPPQSREIMRLHYMDNYRFTEIAKLLGMTPASVRQIHYRTKLLLRQKEKHIRSLMTD